MASRNDRVCPVELARGLDNKIRRWLQNPEKMLKPYIHEGMTVMDLGCGPGFFTMDIARLVGKSGKVIAVDLQEGMLQKVREKMHGTAFENRIILHQCKPDAIGLSTQVDFVLAFYMIHEVPNRQALFAEIASLLKPNGQMLIVEPPLHVSKKAFEDTLKTASEAGLTPVSRPKIPLSYSVILQKG